MGWIKYRYWGGLRFLLALLVVVQHFSNVAGGSVAAIIDSWLPGTVAVKVFFALSGFIILEAIYGIYFDKPFRFIANRAIRVLTPYYPLLLLAVILIAAAFYTTGADQIRGYRDAMITRSDIGWENVADNAFFLWIRGAFPFFHWTKSEILVPFWSVRIEFVFYLFCFCCLLPIAAIPPQKKLQVLDGVAVLSIFSTTAACLFFLSIADLTKWEGFNSGLTTFFVLGAVVFLADEREKWLRPLLPLFLIFAAYGYHAATWAVSAADGVKQISMLLILIAVAFGTRNLEVPKLKEWDEKLGDLSFSLFLVHIIIQIFFRNYVSPSFSAFTFGIFFSILAAIGYQTITAPVINHLRDLVRGRRIDEIRIQSRVSASA